MRLLTTVARLDIILYSRSSAVDSASFLTNAMRLKHQMPFMPERIGQVDRLLGSTMDKQTGQKLSGSGGSSTPASMVPEAWGPCKSVARGRIRIALRVALALAAASDVWDRDRPPTPHSPRPPSSVPPWSDEQEWGTDVSSTRKRRVQR